VPFHSTRRDVLLSNASFNAAYRNIAIFSMAKKPGYSPFSCHFDRREKSPAWNAGFSLRGFLFTAFIEMTVLVLWGLFFAPTMLSL
jgi:hypothetical protein